MDINEGRSKRSPAITFDFDTLWSSTQVNKILTSERDKVSVALIKASSAEITKKLQVPVAEEEEEENQNTADKNNNNEQTLREEDGDDGEPNSVNEDDGYSNERSDDATDENLGEDTSTACLYYRAEIRAVPLSCEFSFKNVLSPTGC
ncbi:hypothetical protein RMCBS344292_13730 [Rhizopus microsporus]|nr:hypothetical protein RMCBS344292_13730 [Rhizopus microsporus]